jgi:hypothetical protein
MALPHLAPRAAFDSSVHAAIIRGVAALRSSAAR